MGKDKRFRLSAEQEQDVKRIQREIKAGRMPFATDEQLEALWKKCGVDVNPDQETRDAIREGLEQAERGEFVPDDVVAKSNRRHGI